MTTFDKRKTVHENGQFYETVCDSFPEKHTVVSAKETHFEHDTKC